MPNPNIRFPILRRLVVKNYGLFPGQEGAGIDHSFEPGVTVITGINGLGKTTLLNMIYRLLVGPFDPYKDEEEVQLTQSRLTRLVFFNYFSKRDRGAGTRASALGEFDVGDRKLTVTRSLTDLSIASLSIDETVVQQPESLEDQIWRLCGCGSQYDFHLLVRSLLFFMEQKTPVVWNPEAQAEIFRILFLGADDASRLALLASEIQQEDSRRRNLVTALNRYKKQLQKLQPASSVAAEVASRLEDVESRMEAVESELSTFDETSNQLEGTLGANRQKLDSLKLDLEEYTRQLQHAYHYYLGSLFPNLSETAQNVFTNLVGDNGCLVCGSRVPGLALQFQKLAEDGSCPVCHTPKDQQEQTSDFKQNGAGSLREQNSRIAALKQDIKEFEDVVISETESYTVLLQRRLELEVEHRKLKRDGERLRGFLPATAEEVSRTQNYITVSEKEIGDLESSLSASLDEYTHRLNSLRSQIDDLRENLTQFFAEYAGSFLAEKCNLTFSPQKLLLGQGIERIEFPTFAVQMTSAVSPSLGTTRKEVDDVSESQKEFIDLAFRMAVLRAYEVTVRTRHGAMMVIETPESSLDSVFINNAGQMLRNWCALGENSVIATSNLNRENMIRSLLGIGRENGEGQPTHEEIRKRVLNLLALAAENAALKRHRDEYEAEFRNSTGLETIND